MGFLKPEYLPCLKNTNIDLPRVSGLDKYTFKNRNITFKNILQTSTIPTHKYWLSLVKYQLLTNLDTFLSMCLSKKSK